MRCAALFVVFLTGCPAEAVQVDRPASAIPCTTDADCNPGRTPLCGLIRACVDGSCEGTPTATVHCP